MEYGQTNFYYCNFTNIPVFEKDSKFKFNVFFVYKSCKFSILSVVAGL